MIYYGLYLLDLLFKKDVKCTDILIVNVLKYLRIIII